MDQASKNAPPRTRIYLVWREHDNGMGCACCQEIPPEFLERACGSMTVAKATLEELAIRRIEALEEDGYEPKVASPTPGDDFPAESVTVYVEDVESDGNKMTFYVTEADLHIKSPPKTRSKRHA
jgi:hypothetical protein